MKGSIHHCDDVGEPSDSSIRDGVKDNFNSILVTCTSCLVIRRKPKAGEVMILKGKQPARKGYLGRHSQSQ
jgi:hypothetical protein